MKPLELSSIAEVWKSALSILANNLASIGTDLQLWFPWGPTWRGHDEKSILPSTDLPQDLISSKAVHFGGRIWKALPINGLSWLISLKAFKKIEKNLESWQPLPETQSALNLLGEFVKLECLLGLTMRILENRAAERSGHWDRVRNFCVAIGRQLNLSQLELVDLELAALLHDIGKVALPGSLLEEARPLSPGERKQIETHSLVGSTMIREIPGFERVADAVLCHHECPDGSGYPKGLKAIEIPLNSLIIGAVDTFDAMTHYRPYAAERTYHDSINEMIHNIGKYDDRVLWALQDVLKNLGILDIRPKSMKSKPQTEATE